jgi:hypothetical protein
MLQAPIDKPSLVKYCKGPNIDLSTTQILSILMKSKFYLKLLAYPYSPLNLYYASITTIKNILASQNNSKVVYINKNYPTYQL